MNDSLSFLLEVMTACPTISILNNLSHSEIPACYLEGFDIVFPPQRGWVELVYSATPPAPRPAGGQGLRLLEACGRSGLLPGFAW